VQDARRHLKKIGDEIRGTGIHQKIAPLVIGILGYGNVSRGAQQIFDCLPLERISAIDLAQLADRTGPDPKTVYLTVFKEEDIVRRRDGSAFSLEEYYDYPERYESSFEAYLPHISILVNAIYWEERYPRFVTWEALRKLYRRQRPAKLCGIADITCDTHGSVECNVRSTDSAMPAYRCDPMTETVSDGHVGDGIVVLAVDNLPCELPADSSVFFSGQLKPFIPNLIRADFFSRFETSRLCPEISKAVIVYRGELTPAYRYLKRYLG
jgi:alpha-aminoadipic semialdehyde synthase